MCIQKVNISWDRCQAKTICGTSMPCDLVVKGVAIYDSYIWIVVTGPLLEWLTSILHPNFWRKGLCLLKHSTVPFFMTMGNFLYPNKTMGLYVYPSPNFRGMLVQPSLKLTWLNVFQTLFYIQSYLFKANSLTVFESSANSICNDNLVFNSIVWNVNKPV